MMPKPPAAIEDMATLYYADVRPYHQHLKKYMPLVPAVFVIVQEPDGTIDILGTDAEFGNWEAYTNYVFKELGPALEFPHVIFRIDDFTWIKL